MAFRVFGGLNYYQFGYLMKLFLFLTFILSSISLTYAKEIKVHFVKEPPEIDGIETAQVWVIADSGLGFIQLEPEKGNPASENTIVYIMQNDEHIFIAFRCYQKDPATIVANITARDQLYKSDDAVMVLPDTFDDQRTGFSFLVNPLGTQTDLRINDDGRNTDRNWDTEWLDCCR